MTGYLFVKGYDEDFQGNPPTCPCYNEKFVEWRIKMRKQWDNRLQWHNLEQITKTYYGSKSQFEHQYKMYIREIEQFFNGAISKVRFPIECIIDGRSPVLRFICLEEIPPKLMQQFCEEFGFYAPTVDITENFEIREYSFIKR